MQNDLIRGWGQCYVSKADVGANAFTVDTDWARFGTGASGWGGTGWNRNPDISEDSTNARREATVVRPIEPQRNGTHIVRVSGWYELEFNCWAAWDGSADVTWQIGVNRPQDSALAEDNQTGPSIVQAVTAANHPTFLVWRLPLQVDTRVGWGCKVASGTVDCTPTYVSQTLRYLGEFSEYSFS